HIASSTLSGNSAGNGGGGFGGVGGGGGGGGVFNSGTLHITSSTLSGNSAGNGGSGDGFGGSIGGVGGGGGGVFNSGTLHIASSTLSGNSAGNGGGGGGSGDAGVGGIGGAVLNAGSEDSTILASTIAGNTAGRLGGAIHMPDIDGSLTLTNTLVAENTADDDTGNCFVDDAGDLIDDGGNLDDATTCDFGASSLSDAAPGLDPAGLSDNGGPTQTIAITSSSDALDEELADPGCQDTDQRGISRPQGGVCDIGAYEFASNTLLVQTAGAGSAAVAAEGVVTSSPGDISCERTGGDDTQGICGDGFEDMIEVTLTATPTSPQTTARIEGACTAEEGASGEAVDCSYVTDTDDPHQQATATFTTLDCTITGSGSIKGTSGDDIICGSDGLDIIYCNGGDDVIIAGDGNDRIYGGAGNDQIFGGAGNDYIYGQDGEDALFGESGNDRLYGGDHDDSLNGGAGTDTCHGQSGNDERESCEAGSG
ncbi:MAG: calcium-binding protein, partial [Actinomycetota bacterium]